RPDRPPLPPVGGRTVAAAVRVTAPPLSFGVRPSGPAYVDRSALLGWSPRLTRYPVAGAGEQAEKGPRWRGRWEKRSGARAAPSRCGAHRHRPAAGLHPAGPRATPSPGPADSDLVAGGRPLREGRVPQSVLRSCPPVWSGVDRRVGHDAAPVQRNGDRRG